MQWGNPNILYTLLVIPLLVFLFVISGYIRKKRFRSFADDKFYDFFFQKFSSFHWQLKNILLLIPLVLLIIAAARPQWGQEVQIVHKEGLDIVLCIDVSKSMLATDIRPNRLQRAKDQISYFIDRLEGDRIAIVPFAGSSFIKLPMTDDYQAARMFLGMVDTGSVPVAGTNIGDALLTAKNAFPDPDRNKVIILISDGEDLGQRGVDIAKEVGNEGIIVHTLGIGSPDGSPIRIETDDGSYEYIKWEDEIVISKLDVDVLGRIANNAGGQFFMVTPHQAEIYEILRTIEELEKDRYDAKEYVRYQDQYLYFTLPALLLIIFESLLLYTKKRENV